MEVRRTRGGDVVGLNIVGETKIDELRPPAQPHCMGKVRVPVVQGSASFPSGFGVSAAHHPSGLTRGSVGGDGVLLTFGVLAEAVPISGVCKGRVYGLCVIGSVVVRRSWSAWWCPAGPAR
jgi:hypothetical protein